MKHILLFLLGILFTLSLSAQELDSCYNFTYTSFDSISTKVLFVNGDRVVRNNFSYNGSGQVTQHTTQLWDGTEWINDERYNFTYTQGGLISTEVYRKGDGSGNLENVSRIDYSYNGSGQETQRTIKSWNGAEWINDEQFENTYTSGGLVSTEVYREGDGNGNLENVSRIDYSYNGSGQETQRTIKSWNGAEWINDEQFENTYTSGGLVSTEVYREGDGNGNLENVSRIDYSYNGSGQETQRTIKSWNGTEWINDEQFENTYTSGGLISTEVYREGDGSGNLENVSRIDYSYNGSGQETQRTIKSWNGTEWINDEQFAITYTAGGLVSTEVFRERDVNGNLVNVTRNNFAYNGSGQVEQHTIQLWDGSEWINDERFNFTYTQDGLVSTEVYRKGDGNGNLNNIKKYVYFYTLNSRLLSEKREQEWIDNNWQTICRLRNSYTSTDKISESCNSCGSEKLIEVKFSVDLSSELDIDDDIFLQGSFNEEGNQKLEDDNGDKVYEGSVMLTPGSYFYRFMNGSSLVEQFLELDECLIEVTLESGEEIFARSLQIDDSVVMTEDDLILDVSCFESCEECSVTATEDKLSLSNEFKIYPTVTNGDINILSVNSLSFNVMIFDINGNRVFESFVRNGQKGIHFEGLSNGIYNLVIRTENNQSFAQRIVYFD
jgi:hypothetical protein